MLEQKLNEPMRQEIALALSQARLLPSPRSDAFKVDEIPTLAHTYVARIRLLDPEAPVTTLIFKRSGAGPAAFLTIREARFYRSIAPALPPGLTPRCFFAADQDGVATLLLEDLGSTHQFCEGACPSLEQATLFVEALAELHASAQASLAEDWAQGVGSTGYDTISGRLGLRREFISRFLHANGADLAQWERDLMTAVAAAHERLAGFAQEQTILHGDANYWNALYAPARAVLLDWGNACLGPGAIDVAHAVALNLPREAGRRWEARLIEAYCRRSTELGRPETPATFADKYRLAVAYAVCVPAGHWLTGVPRDTWRSLLTNALAAARDLDVLSVL